MEKLTDPQIGNEGTITNIFSQVCWGITFVMMFSIIWVAIGNLVWRIIEWLF